MSFLIGVVQFWYFKNPDWKWDCPKGWKRVGCHPVVHLFASLHEYSRADGTVCMTEDTKACFLVNLLSVCEVLQKFDWLHFCTYICHRFWFSVRRWWTFVFAFSYFLVDLFQGFAKNFDFNKYQSNIKCWFEFLLPPNRRATFLLADSFSLYWSELDEIEIISKIEYDVIILIN